MLGGRNTVSSTAAIPNYVNPGRRHLNQNVNNAAVVNNVALMLTPSTFSPHSIYTPQQLPGDPYRSNGTTSMTNDLFPATPYTPVSSLFMSPVVRNTLAAPHTTHPKRPVTHVTSSKFSAYTTIFNLEPEAQLSALFPKVRTQVYQTTNRFFGSDILLRRVVNVPISADACKTVCDTLRQYRHPNLVPISNIIATDEFVMGSSDILMEYRYIAGAKSLYEAFFTEGNRATEAHLWSMACQLVGLLRSFHETLLPIRGLHWSKLLYVETTGRYYFTGLGMMELLDPKALPPIPQLLMKADIQALGLILFQLAARSLSVSVENFNYKQPMLGFSQSFWELIKTCLEGNSDAAQLCHALGERMSMEVGHQQGQCDYLLNQCGKEMHNGRLMRLLMKMNFVLEYISDMQDYTSDSQRHALRLFNQFVFNQVDEQNRVHLDWGHAYHCLNKLDCGSEETIQLIGNDGSTTIMVVSYADLRGMLESLFQQVVQASNESDTQLYAMASPGMI